jgi:transposase-like protein
MLAAYTGFRRTQPNIDTEILIPVTNPIERLNKEVKRRADVVGIFPNEASILRLIGAVLFEQNDEWQTSSRYMMVEAFARIDTEEIDPILSITTKAA